MNRPGLGAGFNRSRASRGASSDVTVRLSATIASAYPAATFALDPPDFSDIDLPEDVTAPARPFTPTPSREISPAPRSAP